MFKGIVYEIADKNPKTRGHIFATDHAADSITADFTRNFFEDKMKEITEKKLLVIEVNTDENISKEEQETLDKAAAFTGYDKNSPLQDTDLKLIHWANELAIPFITIKSFSEHIAQIIKPLIHRFEKMVAAGENLNQSANEIADQKRPLRINLSGSN